MSEIEKLRALLSEARAMLFPHSSHTDAASQNAADLLDRIDAALAESPPSVAWTTHVGGLVQTASVGGFQLLVEQRPWCWRWRTAPVSTYGWDGACRTLEEAKAAALDAVGKLP